MVNDNYFPKTIKQIVLDDNQKPNISEVPFDLANWINPNLINEFGLETVTNALSNLQYSFRELREIKKITSKGFNLLEMYPINSFWFNNSETKQIKEVYCWKTVTIDKYVFFRSLVGQFFSRVDIMFPGAYSVENEQCGCSSCPVIRTQEFGLAIAMQWNRKLRSCLKVLKFFNLHRNLVGFNGLQEF